jgi:hypothetical protein
VNKGKVLSDHLISRNPVTSAKVIDDAIDVLLPALAAPNKFGKQRVVNQRGFALG